jgi:hypothetical protein
MSIQNSTDTIGNRTRDLPACCAVPQLAAPPRGCSADSKPIWFVTSDRIVSFLTLNSRFEIKAELSNWMVRGHTHGLSFTNCLASAVCLSSNSWVTTAVKEYSCSLHAHDGDR